MSYQQIENITLNESINVNQFLNLQNINKILPQPYDLIGNLLVVGGIGYIGSNFINTVFNLYPNMNFYVLDNLSGGYSIETIDINIRNNSRYKFFNGNMGDISLVKNILESNNITYILQLAAWQPFQNASNVEFVNNNVQKLTNFFEACSPFVINEQLKLILFQATQLSSPLQAQDLLGSTSLFVQPVLPSIYETTKTSGLTIANYYQRYYNYPMNIILPTHVFGGQNQHSQDILLSYANSLYSNIPITIYQGDSISKDSWVNIYDVIDAYNIMLNNGYVNNYWYNLNNPIQTFTHLNTAQKMIKQIKNETDYNKWLIYSPEYTSVHNAPQPFPSSNLIGWNPKITLQSEIDKFPTQN